MLTIVIGLVSRSNSIGNNNIPIPVAVLQEQGDFLCGGAAIAINWILTSGQCIRSFSPIVVRVGRKFNESGEILNVTHNSVDIYDVAFLKLATSITLDDNHQPAIMPSGDDKELEEGTPLIDFKRNLTNIFDNQEPDMMSLLRDSQSIYTILISIK